MSLFFPGALGISAEEEDGEGNFNVALKTIDAKSLFILTLQECFIKDCLNTRQQWIYWEYGTLIWTNEKTSPLWKISLLSAFHLYK